jgi:hypothetical protein
MFLSRKTTSIPPGSLDENRGLLPKDGCFLWIWPQGTEFVLGNIYLVCCDPNGITYHPPGYIGQIHKGTCLRIKFKTSLWERLIPCHQDSLKTI